MIAWASAAVAQAPQRVHYQGRLSAGTNLANGTYGLSLRLYSGPVGGSSLYEDSNQVAIADGLYATFLGDQTNQGSLATALAASNLFLGVAINGGPELTPRESVGSVFYALVADSVRSGGVSAAAIADGAIPYAKLQDSEFFRVEADGTVRGGGYNTMPVTMAVSNAQMGVNFPDPYDVTLLRGPGVQRRGLYRIASGPVVVQRPLSPNNEWRRLQEQARDSDAETTIRLTFNTESGPSELNLHRCIALSWQPIPQVGSSNYWERMEFIFGEAGVP